MPAVIVPRVSSKDLLVAESLRVSSLKFTPSLSYIHYPQMAQFV
jgi:hypothetical protein